MKERNLILSALAVLALVACTKVENLVPVTEVETPASSIPMDFGIYMPQTKAGSPGMMDNAKLQSDGFGVFAYIYAGNYEDNSSSLKPNFMFNEKVTYSDPNWIYAPVKYWPNQLDGSGAQKLSFFAYAPYADLATEDPSYGIVAMTDGSVTGDPTVTYRVSGNLNENVDLVWGVSNGGTWTNVSGLTKPLTEGLPYLNIQKPHVGTRVTFKFFHALAQLNLTAVGAYNVTAAGGTPKSGVKVTIKEVRLTVPSQYDQAVLNLNNSVAKTPSWDLSGATEKPLTLVVDGDKLNDNVRDAGAVRTANQPAGVTATEGPVLATSKYFTLIPRAVNTTVTVQITYYVTTDDDNLDDGFSRVENVISKSLVFPNGFKAGTSYTIRMILGLSEVSLAAEVVDWNTGETLEVDLPKNEN